VINIILYHREIFQPNTGWGGDGREVVEEGRSEAGFGFEVPSSRFKVPG